MKLYESTTSAGRTSFDIASNSTGAEMIPAPQPPKGELLPWHEWPLAKLGATILLAMRQAENVELSFVLRGGEKQGQSWWQAQALTPVLLSWTTNGRRPFSASYEVWEEFSAGNGHLPSAVHEFLELTWWLSRGRPLGEAESIGKFRVTFTSLDPDGYDQLPRYGLPLPRVRDERDAFQNMKPLRMKMPDYMAALEECREWLGCQE